MLLTAPATPGRSGVLRRRAVQSRRIANRTLAAIGAMTAVLVLVTGQAAASSDPGAAFVAATNQARAAAGLAPLSGSADLTAAATRQAQNMANSGTLFHTPHLGSGLCCWLIVGENVGQGPSEAVIQAAFMASPDHRANILSGAYSQLGIGYVIDRNGTLWVSEIFRRPSGSTAPVTPKVTPKVVAHPTPRPSPVARKPVEKVRIVLVRPPLNPVAAEAVAALAPPRQVSRDLVRLPLEEAERLTVQFGEGNDVVTGTDPVSRLLDFAAKAGGSD